MSEQRRWLLDASAALHAVMRLPTAEAVIDTIKQAKAIIATMANRKRIIISSQ